MTPNWTEAMLATIAEMRRGRRSLAEMQKVYPTKSIDDLADAAWATIGRLPSQAMAYLRSIYEIREQRAWNDRGSRRF